MFSGIGGLELGLEWAGVGHTVWQCELSSGQGDLWGAEDTYTRAVLKKNWPGVRIFDDVRRLGVTEDIPPVDVLCGGFPCQDISQASQGGKGLEGKRSGLFWEIVRIAELIEPRFIVLENVANLVNKGLETVLEALDRVGYDAEWHTLSAADIGAPHLRKRVFIIAWRQQLAHASGEGSQRYSGNVEVGDEPRRINKRSDGGPFGDDSFLFPPRPGDVRAWPHVPMDFKPALCRVAHGVSPWVVYRKPILTALGNAVVPQCAEVIGRRLMEIYLEQA